MTTTAADDQFTAEPLSFCMDCGAEAGQVHHHNCATHERLRNWGMSEALIDRSAQSDASGAHHGRAPSKYHVRLGSAWVDVYDVLMAFGVTNPADAHAIKKMLMPGKRGHKDGVEDRREAIQSLERAIELEVGQ